MHTYAHYSSTIQVTSFQLQGAYLKCRFNEFCVIVWVWWGFNDKSLKKIIIHLKKKNVIIFLFDSQPTHFYQSNRWDIKSFIQPSPSRFESYISVITDLNTHIKTQPRMILIHLNKILLLTIPIIIYTDYIYIMYVLGLTTDRVTYHDKKIVRQHIFRSLINYYIELHQ